MSKYLRIPARTEFFPLRTDLGYGSLMQPQLDIQPDKNKQPVVQAIAVCNLLPTTDGYTGAYWFARNIYNEAQTQNTYMPQDCGRWDQVPLIIRDENDNLSQIFFTPAGHAYLINGNNPTPKDLGVFPTDGAEITQAYVKEISLIHVAWKQTYVYDTSLTTLVPQELKGLVPEQLLGITAANGFCIAYDDETIYWSNADNPTDFQASEISGAGSTRILDAKGPIVLCKPIDNGFLIYTTRNVVAALWSGQSIPWVFREIKGSAGLNRICHATQDINTGTHFVWSTEGLMQLNKSEARKIFPQITEYLNDAIWEDVWGPAVAGGLAKFEPPYDLVGQLNYGAVNQYSKFNVNLQYVGGRYLCISYGPSVSNDGANTEFRLHRGCLVYDTVLDAWGNLVRDHAYTYTNPSYSPYSAVTWNDLQGSWTDQGTKTWDDYYDSTYSPQVPDQTFGMFVFQPYENRMVDSMVITSWEFLDQYTFSGSGPYDQVVKNFRKFNGTLISQSSLDFTNYSGENVVPVLEHSVIYGFFNINRNTDMSVIQVKPYQVSAPVRSTEIGLQMYNSCHIKYAYEGALDGPVLERSSYGRYTDTDLTYHFYNWGRNFEVQIVGPMKLSLVEIEADFGGTRR
jgi:hypothetical protein